MKIGIIGAMHVEVELLKQKMWIEEIRSIAGMEFCSGRIGETPVVVVQSGIGKVNAAVCTEILIGLYEVTHVLNTGIAGSLQEDIGVMDLVISTDAVYHDFDSIHFGYQPGEVPQMHIVSFPADETLRLQAAAAVRKSGGDFRVAEGRIASGDQFINDPEKKKWIAETFHAQCVEMEGTAIAHTAWVNHVPFVIIRAISDNAGTGMPMEYETFEQIAAEKCAAIVFDIVQSLNS